MINELTLEELELVRGGMNYRRREVYHANILNIFTPLGHLDKALDECGVACHADFEDEYNVWDWHKGWG